MAVDVGTNGSAIELGTPKALFDIRVAATFFQVTPIFAAAKTPSPYAVTKDGQRFLVITDNGQLDEAPMTVVVNWPAGLKK